MLGTGQPWTVVCDRPGIPDGQGNLCWKAARAYFDAAALDPGGLRIEICKAIPAQAGMAGGSSDAAAVLRALNRHYGRFTETQLRAIGLTVGSDVPYCLFGGAALAQGRGEILTRLPELRLCLDLCHLDKAGYDLPAWIGAHAGRVDMVHFKDEKDGRLVPAGQGDVRYAGAVRACLRAGVAYGFAEQEAWEGDPFVRIGEALDWLRGELAAEGDTEK